MVGAIRAGWDIVVGIERDETYANIGRRRLAFWSERRGTIGAVIEAASLELEHAQKGQMLLLAPNDEPSTPQSATPRPDGTTDTAR